MRQLKIVWGILITAGLTLIALGYGFETLFRIGEVPGLIAVGTALILLAVASMVNWAFKAAWEERSRHNSANGESSQSG